MGDPITICKKSLERKIYWKKYEINCFCKLLSDPPWFNLYECSNACDMLNTFVSSSEHSGKPSSA